MGLCFLFQTIKIRLDVLSSPRQLAASLTPTSTLIMSLEGALPESLFFDFVSAEEIKAVHELEVQGKPTYAFPYVSNVMMCVIRFFTRRSCYPREATVRLLCHFPITILDVHRYILLASVRQMPQTSSLVPSFLRQAANVPSLVMSMACSPRKPPLLLSPCPPMYPVHAPC